MAFGAGSDGFLGSLETGEKCCVFGKEQVQKKEQQFRQRKIYVWGTVDVDHTVQDLESLGTAGP